MPWNEQKGGGGGGPWGGGSSSGSGGSSNGGSGGGSGPGPGGGDKSPWGRPGRPSGPGGGGGGDKPDLEESIRRMQERFRRSRGGGNGRPGGPSGGKPSRGFGATGVLIALAVTFVGWLMTGVYTVNEQEAAVVMRFGTVHRTEGPGFHVRFPSPIEEQLIVPVNRSQFVEIGATENESLILTRDGNIVDIDFAINWKIASPEKYLFNVVDKPNPNDPASPNELIRQVGESAMREVVGNEDFVPLLTSARGNVEGRVLKIMQDMLNSYNSGVDVISISLKKSSAPPDVLDAQRDVTSAQQDREKKNNEGRSYLNKVTNEAEGEAARLRKEADGYRDSTIAVSRGEAEGFTKVYDEYRRSPESRRVTRERIFLETMEEVIGRTNKVIVDTKTGAVPVLPLDLLRPRQQQ